MPRVQFDAVEGSKKKPHNRRLNLTALQVQQRLEIRLAIWQLVPVFGQPKSSSVVQCIVIMIKMSASKQFPESHPAKNALRISAE